MKRELTILGCGSSSGVPRVAQGWGACDPAHPRNRRRRCSVLVRQGSGEGRETVVIVDLSPDLREQLLMADVRYLDAILVTHAHADHVHGIDDIRPMVHHLGRRLPVHMDEPTADTVKTAFSYIFETPPGSLYVPLLDDARISPGVVVGIDGPGGRLEAMPFRLTHGEIDALGFRFGDVAYTPDLNGVPNESAGFLEGLDVWIIDALRYKPHPSHLCLDEALELVERFRPKRAILTNLCPDMDYATLQSEIPDRVEVAFDGMVLDV